MKERTAFNDNWLYKPSFDAADPFGAAETEGYVQVELPHTNKILPYNCFDEAECQFISCYKKIFRVKREWEDKTLLLEFEGVMLACEVWCNGISVGGHEGGFTPFQVDLTKAVKPGEENILIVKVDSTERKDIPPFGNVVDYLTYGGIYREAWLTAADPVHLSRLFLDCPEPLEEEKTLRCSCEITARQACKAMVKVTLYSPQGDRVGEKTEEVALQQGKGKYLVTLSDLKGIELWEPDTPALYTAEAEVAVSKERDICRERFGFRLARFTPEGFFLNGRKMKLIGLNRHQSWPYAGYAMPRRIQRKDAQILKEELGCNMVRTSHYPQSRHFLDACDEKGIMIFQDMMLACGIFPQDAGFLQEVFEETGVIVRKNINRTCIMIWSADNELDEAYRWYDMLDRFRENKVNREAVRKGVEENDSSRPFLVSSPCSPFEQDEGGEDPNSDKQGDMHLYLTRFLKNDEYYYKKILELKPRFMSEYGFSSLPWEPSYYRFNFRREPVDLVRNPWLAQLDWLREVGEKGDVSEIIYYSQFTHAQGLKYWIEYLRSLKWHCGGSLYWKFNDPIAPNRENMLFPSLMSCIDFFRLPKLAYYYARRAYEDKILAFREDLEGNLAVYGCNETDSIADGTLCVSLKTYGGETVWCDTVPCIMDRDHASLLYRIPAERLADGPSCSCYVYAAFAAGEERLVNLFHLTEVGEWNQVEMPRAALKAELREAGDNTLEITVSADSFVQDVTIEILDEDVYYSDNSFCLEKGERAVIQAKLTASGRDGGKMRIRAYNADPVCRSFSR